MMLTAVVTCMNERDGWIHPALAAFMLEWASRVPGWVRIVRNYRPHHNARNEAVRLFLQDGSDWLFMIDNDTCPPPGTFDLLNQIDGRDVVAIPYPFYRIKEGQFSVADCVFKLDPASGKTLEPAGKITEPGFHEIAACGTGAVLIHRRVLEGLKPPHFRPTENPVDPSEDVDFCFRAREAGFRIWTTADFGRAEHFKTVPLSHLY